MAADIIKGDLNVYLKVPVETRWNSTLVALLQLLELYEDKPNEIRCIYEKCQIEEHILKRDQLEFLRKYVKVSKLTSTIFCKPARETIQYIFFQIMTPIAKALDMFQGEHYMYMGIFSPCVIQMINELKSQRGSLRTDDPLQFLITTLLESIKKR